MSTFIKPDTSSMSLEDIKDLKKEVLEFLVELNHEISIRETCKNKFSNNT